jgi:hypothetical protein
MRGDGQVGPNVYSDAGQPQPIREGSYGEMVVSDFHGLWAEETLRGNAFAYNTTSAAAFAAFGSNQPTLWNPAGSGKICILGRITIQAAAVGTPAISGLQYGFIQNAGSSISGALTGGPVLTFTSVAPQNLCVSGPQKGSKMLWAPAVSTFTTAPAFLAAVGFNLGGTATFTPFTFIDNIDGRIILWPGSILQIAASAATSTTFNTSIWGLELPAPAINQ